MIVNFVVHTFDKKDRGGVLRVVTDLANNFVKNDIGVRIISFGNIAEPAFYLDKRVQLIALDMKKYNTTFFKSFSKLGWFYAAYKAIKEILILSPSTVWITTSPPISLLFAFLKYLFDIKVIGCDHTSTLYKKHFFFQKIRNKLLSKLDVMIGLNPQDVEYYKRNRINSVCIPNGIDFVDVVRQNNEKKYLIYVGRFAKEKQPIKAIDLFVNSNLPSQGIIMRMFGHGELEIEVKEYIVNNKYSNIIEIVTDESNPNNIYQDAFVLLMTSKTEGFPMVLLEAIAREVPCISFDCPYGPRNIIINGVNGFLFDENTDNFNDFLEKIKKLPIGMNDSISEFRIENIMKKYIRLFGDLSVDK